MDLEVALAMVEMEVEILMEVAMAAGLRRGDVVR
jgi:hypothetical protein